MFAVLHPYCSLILPVPIPTPLPVEFLVESVEFELLVPILPLELILQMDQLLRFLHSLIITDEFELDIYLLFELLRGLDELLFQPPILLF